MYPLIIIVKVKDKRNLERGKNDKFPCMDRESARTFDKKPNGHFPLWRCILGKGPSTPLKRVIIEFQLIQQEEGPERTRNWIGKGRSLRVFRQDNSKTTRKHGQITDN
jgi:hypothetical protein